MFGSKHSRTTITNFLSLTRLRCPIIACADDGRRPFRWCNLVPNRRLNSQTHGAPISSSVFRYRCVTLPDRAVIRVSGPDTIEFLQGLITNDAHHLVNNDATAVSRRCIYSFMLNNSGRILADLFIYCCAQKQDELLLEVDANITESILSLLKRYKIRRKVKIANEPACEVSVIFPECPETATNISIESVSCDNMRFVTQDPRSFHLGYRILSLASGAPSIRDISTIFCAENDSFKSIAFEEMMTADHGAAEYRIFRYRLGIGEGAVDFPPESIFPFEANAELLNAVSFHKGCYVGQELTARTYHTGVIRKRLMPIEIDHDLDMRSPNKSSLPVQSVVLEKGDDQRHRIMGRFRVNCGRFGLASLKHNDLFGPNLTTAASAEEHFQLKLDQSGYLIRATRPFWWPNNI